MVAAFRTVFNLVYGVLLSGCRTGELDVSLTLNADQWTFGRYSGTVVEELPCPLNIAR